MIVQPVVRARDVSVSLGGRAVLRGVDVALEAGDRCALLGRSGSGKTTLLLVLAGLLAPDLGRVELSVPARDVVYVPQAPSLVPELTAVQNASLGLRIRGVDPAEALDRAREQLRALHLADADEALPAELSGGMQQRVALARALAVGPAVLLADEPTGALDRATGAAAVDAVLHRAKADRTCLVVATHDPEVAARLDRQLTVAREVAA